MNIRTGYSYTTLVTTIGIRPHVEISAVVEIPCATTTNHCIGGNHLPGANSHTSVNVCTIANIRPRSNGCTITNGCIVLNDRMVNSHILANQYVIANLCSCFDGYIITNGHSIANLCTLFNGYTITNGYMIANLCPILNGYIITNGYIVANICPRTDVRVRALVVIASEAVALTVLCTKLAVVLSFGCHHTFVEIEVADIGLAIRLAPAILTDLRLRNALVVWNAPAAHALTWLCAKIAISTFALVWYAPLHSHIAA
jgi:hypothetical protein